jgi:hypothetical protein
MSLGSVNPDTKDEKAIEHAAGLSRPPRQKAWH